MNTTTPIWITAASHDGDFRLALTFSDGASKTVDLQHELHGEIFAPLREVERFKHFRVSDWSVEWDNGADFAPEFLRDL